ncbi:MAG: response regulator [Candidatus Sericytochromatia bacterium]|nr:response regulator [Candidatus Sericytochromatia bacterium]
MAENQREHKLQRLVEASMLLHQELSLEALLGRLVDATASLVDAKYVALVSLKDDHTIDRFIYRGLTPEQVAAMPHVPHGKGLLGALLTEGRPLRLAEMRSDPRSIGFPEGHPPMHGFLGVPILWRGRVFGRLYCTEKLSGPEFTAEDEEIVTMLAAQAAVAIENAGLYEHARAASRLKSEFLANMSHELRTPMNAILGFTELVHNGMLGPVTEKQKEGLGRVLRNARNLLDLINDVLDLSKIEAGRMEVAVQNFNPRAVVEGVAATIEPLAAKKGLEIRLALAEAPEAVVGDEGKVRQIVMNLVSNAVKFTEAGTIVLTLGVQEANWTVAVKDSGIGIAPDLHGLIFEEFRQVDASSTRSRGGTGLGLAICQKMARLMGGYVTVASTPGSGSTFTLHLPIEAASATPVVEPSRTGRSSGREGALLLAIDDDPDVLELLTTRLAGTEFEVVTALGGEVGLREAERLKPDVITLDVVMPGFDGWEVLRRLKANPDLAAIPVVMMSILENRALSFSMGAADCVAKPVAGDHLLEVLRRSSGTSGPVSVLVVDDEPDARHLIGQVLEAAGHSWRGASDGAEALAAIRQARPELVVLDLLMPNMDGFTVLETLAADASLRSIPVVVVSAMALSAEDEARLERGARCILSKASFTPDELIAELQIHLGARKAHP